MTIIETLKSQSFTLSLSAGYFGFFAHLGLLKILEEENIKPQRIIGASSGAITGGMWASGVTCDEIKKLILSIKKSDFWDPGFGLGLNKGQKFEKIIRKFLPHKFSDTHIPLSVTAVEVPHFKTRVFDEGPLAPALRASASLPGLFHPLKRNRRYFIDGGIFDKTGLIKRQGNEKVLFHYLRSGGLLGKLEAFRDRNTFKPHDILVYGEPNTTVGPASLHLGEDEFQRSYKKMRALLFAGA